MDQFLWRYFMAPMSLMIFLLKLKSKNHQTATAFCTYHNNLNSLAPGKFEWNFRYVILKWLLVVDSWGISCEIALKWMSLDFTDDQSILVQVMAWCRQAASHYLSQCWPRSLSPYGVTRPQWFNVLICVKLISQLIIISYKGKLKCHSNFNHG